MQYWQFLSGDEQLQNVNLDLIFEDIDRHEFTHTEFRTLDIAV